MKPDKKEAINLIASAIEQLVAARYYESNTGRLSAQTILATTAAITGEMIRYSANDMKKPADIEEAKDSLREATKLLQTLMCKLGRKAEELPSFDAILAHTLENPKPQDGPVLTTDSYYAPHEPPAIGAAALREDVLFLMNAFELEPEDFSPASFIALIRTISGVRDVLPAEIANRMSMEVMFGAVFMEPLDRSLAPTRNKLFTSDRLHAAAHDLADILIRQSAAVDNGIPSGPTLLAKTGALIGEMTRNVVLKDSPIEADYVSSAEIDAYLEDVNVLLMASYIRRGGDAEELAEYGEYVANAAASIGRAPYPKHNVPTEFLPRECPAAEAAMVREPFEEIARTYKLTDWEKPTICVIALNNLIKHAETVMPTSVAVRLAMEEAAAIARVKPANLDEIESMMPPDIRKSFQTVRAQARKAAELKPA